MGSASQSASNQHTPPPGGTKMKFPPVSRSLNLDNVAFRCQIVCSTPERVQ